MPVKAQCILASPASKPISSIKIIKQYDVSVLDKIYFSSSVTNKNADASLALHKIMVYSNWILKYQFDLENEVKIFVIKDKNAYAAEDGKIYMGEELLKFIQGKFGLMALPAACQYILAHEFAHQAQFAAEKRGLPVARRGTAAFELQADILAGYFISQSERMVNVRTKVTPLFTSKDGLGLGNQLQDFNPYLKKNQTDLFNVVESLGDYGFGDKAHHGTPFQRRAALTFGIQAGKNGQFVDLVNLNVSTKGSTPTGEEDFREMFLPPGQLTSYTQLMAWSSKQAFDIANEL
jgi:hypothetical protein